MAVVIITRSLSSLASGIFFFFFSFLSESLCVCVCVSNAGIEGERDDVGRFNVTTW